MNDQQALRKAVRAAIAALSVGEPQSIVRFAQVQQPQITAADATVLLRDAEDHDELLTKLGKVVHEWDAADPDEDWTRNTSPSSADRRRLIYELLELDMAGAQLLDERRPVLHLGSIVISGPWKRWYTPARAWANEFYWAKYQDYLSRVRGWPDDSVARLAHDTTEVIERIADPTQVEAYQSKGLVVGYVQSGKTANFTGVAAKAIDAGYRLIIVMTGTIELLRSQTQRRMDMELVGRQNILGDLSEDEARVAKVDYQDDHDWLAGRFLDLEVSDPTVGIRRLTHHRADYKQQFKTLKIDRIDPTKPLFDPANLHRSAARLAIVKKNSTVLGKLVTDIKANRNAFAEIPVLIIDDESDQASVNTVDPEKVAQAKRDGKEVKERMAINQHIASMLELMPRAQYVGYTATPFANVFVDPSDDVGIFPKDFIISLGRPADYMGVEDFHDLEPIEDPPTVANSNRLAYVRMLEAIDGDNNAQLEELAEAIDMFVLTGAVKLYRRSVDPARSYRHHTMLVHHSVRKDDHREVADSIRRLWQKAEFTKPATKARLRNLYETDILSVSDARKPAGLPAMPGFDELVPFVAKAVSRITEHLGNPVLVVNSDSDIQKEQQALDFDRHETWRILVGGSKLSRGFTVEGLTVTYFRRATELRDSLTQMGRWFGFRPGYKDLVRLYMARNARFGARSVDLYDAFESIAIDEAAFRRQLEQYAVWDGDEPQVRPIDIPPLVQQYLPWLKPTAKNKMFNARLVQQSEQGFTPTGYPNDLDSLKRNLELWRPVLASASDPVTLETGTGRSTFEALTGLVSAEALLEALGKSRYLGSYGSTNVEPRMEFYRQLVSAGDVADFLVVAPQLQTDEVVDVAGVGPRRVVSRDRRKGRDGRFGEVTDPKNRRPVESFVSGIPSAPLAPWRDPRRGAVLLYLIREATPSYERKTTVARSDRERGLIAACKIYVPAELIDKQPRAVVFQVVDKARADQPIVPAVATV